MKEDLGPGPYTVKRSRLSLLLLAVSMALVGLGILWAYQRDGRGAAEFNLATSPAARTTTPGSVGTSGAGTASVVADGSGPPAVVSPAIIHELATITGSVDGQELIGRRVDLHVNVQSVPNEVVFWIGEKDNRLLVAIGRNNRDGQADQPRHGIATSDAERQATISGSVQRLPKAEEMDSWRLTERDHAELLDRKVYIRADTVTTDGHGTHGSGI